MATTVDDLESYLPANCPNPYYDTWDRHASIAFSKTKGLRNAPGENNCFLNSAVQVFWHLDVFRRSYRCLTGHVCMGNSCIFCALKVIFTQLQYSDQTSLHPDALRKALAETFANQQRFQLGHMDDAAECFENILRRIHLHIANDYCEDECTAPHCLPHKKFAMAVCDQIVCPCGASSKPHNFQEMVHYVSANALVAQARVMQKTGDVLHPDRFGLLLRNAVAMGDLRDCPGNCGKTVQMRRSLKSCPDVVSVGLVWDSDHPSIEMTTEVARNIGTTIMLQDVFHSVMVDLKTLPKLHLVGVVCYYGKHYSTFVFHSKLKVWIYFDDATVREIGPRWEHVVEKCMRGRYQPLLLLYANPAATPVPVETAPKRRTMAEGFSSSYEDSDSGLDRTQDSIKSMPARRSRTPNPDHHQNVDLGRRAITPGPESYEAPRPAAKPMVEHKRQPSFLYAMNGKPEGNMPQPMMTGRENVLYGGQSSGDQMRMTPHPEEGDDNYTLSTKDPYRRPSLNGFDPSNLPLTQGMGRVHETQRKESFRKGKDKVRSDVIRCTVSPGYKSPSPEYPVGEDSVSINSDIVSPNQHRVVRPKPSQHTYENIDSMSHTPVQSGLATLPRKKNSQHGSEHPSELDLNSLNRQNSMGNLNLNNLVNKPLNKKPMPIPVSMPMPPNMKHCRQDCVDGGPPSHRPPPSPPAQPQRPPPAVPSHERQSSGNKSETKKTKVKKSSKSVEKKRNKKNKEDSVDADMYIDRGMVENILKHQGVKRQVSSVSNASYTSGSSIESDSMMGKLLAGRNGDGKNALSVEIPYDNISIGSYRDSGYGSSDRNSSSSTGSETVNPYSVYFLSRGMIIPNSINNQHGMFDRSHSTKSSPSPENIRDSPLSDVSHNKQGPEQMNNGQQNSHEHTGQKTLHDSIHARQVLHPIKERSFEDSLRASPAAFLDAPKGVVETRRPGQPPRQHQQQQQQQQSPQQMVPSPVPSPPEPITHTVQREAAAGNEKFLLLCHKSDDLMDMCVLAETDGKLDESQRYCDNAIGCLREAMNLKNITHQSLVHAQRKHSACLLKCRSLQLRMSSRSASCDSALNSRLSMNGSDSETSSQDGSIRMSASRERLEKCVSGQAGSCSSSSLRVPSAGHYRSDSGLSRHERSDSGLSRHERSDSGVSRHERQGSASSHHRQTSSSLVQERSQREFVEDPTTHRKVTRSNSDQFSHNDQMVHSHTDSNLSMKSSSSHTSSTYPSGSQENLIDIYATLPRRKNKKPVEQKPKDADVYQSYLNKQKSLNSGVHVEHTRTSSGSSTTNSLEGRESDSGSSSGRSKLSQSEIRDLLERNYVRRHQEQISQRVTSKQQPSREDGRLQTPVNTTQQTSHQHPYQQSAAASSQRPVPMSKPGQQVSEVGRNQRPIGPPPPSRQQTNTYNSGQQASAGPRSSAPGRQQTYNKPSIPPKNISLSNSRVPANGSQVKAPTHSNQYLNVYNMHPQGRPLERSASQPDCQKLVDSSLASNPDRRSPITARGRGDMYPPSTRPGQLSSMRPNSASQPDLRSSPLLASGSENPDEVEEVKQNVSVRALASRFETVTMETHTRRNPVRKQMSDVGQRQRSKSESNSSVNNINPKSVLKKKKAKNNRPRKSVTFCEDIARVANLDTTHHGYESASELSSPRFGVEDRAYYSDDEDRYSHKQGYMDSEVDDMDSSNSDDSPLGGVVNGEPCNLCSKRCVQTGSLYCANCHFYMSRMMPTGQ